MMRLRLLSCGLFFLLSACQGGPERGLPRATALEERAARSLLEGRVREAHELFTQASRTSERPFLSLVGIARCAAQVRNWSLFERALQGAMGHAVRTPEGHDLVARTFLEGARLRADSRREQYALTAATLFGQVLRVDQGVPDAVYHCGLAWYLCGKHQKASIMLAEAYAQRPDSEDTLGLLVGSLCKLDDPERVLFILEPLNTGGRMPLSLEPALRWARERRKLKDRSPRNPS